MEYAYSDNEEMFYGKCATLAEALDEALNNYPDDESVWIGEVTQKTIGGYFFDAEGILECLAETAGNECGEAAEDWLSFPPCGSRRIEAGESREEYGLRVAAWRKRKAEYLGPLDEAIRAALEKWATDNDEQPHFWHVGSPKQYTREEAQAIIDELHH